MTGGSHTDFDTGAFSVGAFTSAVTLAGAIGAGITNWRAENWSRWSRHSLVSGLEFSEAMRARLFRQLTRANRNISDLKGEIISLRAELKAERAKAFLRK